MQKVDKALCAVLFALIFPFACISSSFDPTTHDILFGYFGFHSSAFIFGRYLILFTIIFILSAILSNKTKFLFYAFPAELSVVLALTFYDSFIGHHLLYNYNYILWLCVAICVPCAAVYTAATFFMKENFVKFNRIFWSTFVFLYLFLFYDVFLRQPNSFTMSVNTKIGGGIFRFIPYVINNPGDAYMILNIMGNLLFFLPLPLMLRALIPKLPKFLIVISGIALPLMVEGYQYYFKCGNVDIDDLILNWSGFIIGLILLKLIETHKLKESN